MGHHLHPCLPSSGTRVRTAVLLALGGTLALASANVAALPGLVVPSGGSFSLGGGTLELPCVDFINSGGTVNAAGLINVSGNWGNSGAFNAQGGTVNMNDDDCPSPYVTISGNTTFYRFGIFSDSDPPDKEVHFTAGSTQTVGGVITLLGANGHWLKIRSTVPGSPAFLNVAGGQNINYVDVKDNYATGLYLAPNYPGFFNSVDSGGNWRWFLNTVPGVGGPGAGPGGGGIQGPASVPTLSTTATLLLGLALSALVSWRSRRRSGV